MTTDLIQDLRYAARRLRRSPGFASAAVLTLALGIGANTAIFTVARAIMLEPLPYSDPERVVTVWEDHLALGGRTSELVAAERFHAWVDASTGRIALAAYAMHRPSFDGGDGVRFTRALRVTGAFFEVLGLRSANGRLLSESDALPNAPPVFVVTHAFYEAALGADPSWIGRSVDLDGVMHTLVGVLAPDTHLIVPGATSGNVDIVSPLTAECSGRCDEVFVLAKLADGQTAGRLEDALARVGPISGQLPASGIRVISLDEELTAALGSTMVLLLAGVGLVLLVACVNVANLLIARGPARDAEIAVRTALGARRGRILRQLLTENTMLTLVGGAAGLWVSAWAVDLVLASSSASTRIPRAEAIGIDGVAVMFCAGVTVLTGLILGLVPIFQSARPRASAILNPIGVHGRARSNEGESGNALIILEVAAAGVLLLGAGVLIRSYVHLERASTGYDPDQVLTVDVPLNPEHDNVIVSAGLTTALDEHISPLAGVTAVAAGVLPDGAGAQRAYVLIGDDATPESEGTIGWIRPVTPSYFRFLGLDVIAGSQMTGRSGDVALVNARFARAAWSGGQAAGRTLRVGETTLEVAGIVEDAAAWAPAGNDRPAVYVPIDLVRPAVATVFVAVDGDVNEAVLGIRNALGKMTGTARHAEVITLADRADGSLGQRRLATLLLGGFAATAVILAAIGLIGVLHYGVTRRRYEFGIRMALGATGTSLRNRIIWQGVLLTAVGAAVGVIVTLALRRVLGATLYGVAPTDMVVLAAAPLLLCIVAVVASYVPARKASRIEPVIALRGE